MPAGELHQPAHTHLQSVRGAQAAAAARRPPDGSAFGRPEHGHRRPSGKPHRRLPSQRPRAGRQHRLGQLSRRRQRHQPGAARQLAHLHLLRTGRGLLSGQQSRRSIRRRGHGRHQWHRAVRGGCRAAGWGPCLPRTGHRRGTASGHTIARRSGTRRTTGTGVHPRCAARVHAKRPADRSLRRAVSRAVALGR
jgi:hypothetical protein